MSRIENDDFYKVSSNKSDSYDLKKLSASNTKSNYSLQSKTYPGRSNYRGDSPHARSRYRKSTRYKRDKYAHDDKYKELTHKKGRYYREQTSLEECTRSSAHVSSNKKHRYEKDSLKDIEKHSNTSNVKGVEDCYNVEKNKPKTVQNCDSTLQGVATENNDLEDKDQQIDILEENYIESLMQANKLITARDKYINGQQDQEYFNRRDDVQTDAHFQATNSDDADQEHVLSDVETEIDDTFSDQKNISSSMSAFEETRVFSNQCESPINENYETNTDRKQEVEVVNIADLPPYYPAIQGCRSVNEFHILNHINEGTYGVVYRAVDKQQNDIVALKRLKMDKEKEGFPITSLREINTMLKGQHPNIVTVREIVVGNNMDKIFIVMDFVEHDLKSLIEIMRNQNQSFTAAETKCLLKQLLCAVAYLHDNWILHRDLKTSNLLLSNNGILKVGDFGLAREYGSPLKAYTPIVVTLWYRAPELLLFTKQYSTPIDMWSVGCIFGEFALMNAVFQGKSEIDQLNKVFKYLGTPTENTWPGFNKIRASKKIKLAQYPTSKLSSRFHMLTGQGQGLLQQMLTYNPAQRITAEDALKHPYFEEFPLPIDPSTFPSWPSKIKAVHNREEPKQSEEVNTGFRISASSMDNRKLPVGGGFNLKF